MRISEQNVIVNTFTATNLSESDIIIDADTILDIHATGEGIPYNVSITPVNLAGPGSINSVTLFTREFGKQKVQVHACAC